VRLVALTIRDFRKLAGEWRIGPLDPGFTLIGGDNEEGKSTVLLALKSALFEAWSVGGRTREAMTAHLGGTPRVVVEFELAGTAYRLDKEFGRDCTLAWPGGRLRGDAAEAELQRLLRFEPRRGRAERRPEHQGLSALFWVDQGTSFLAETTEAAIAAQRDRFGALLRRELDMVTAGPRLAALRARVEEAYARYWTERGQEKRTGELATLRAEIAAKESEVGVLRAARGRYDQAVTKLERARAERARAEAPERLERVRARLAAAAEDLARIERLEQDRALARKSVEAEAAELRRLEEELRSRTELRERLARDEAALRALEAERAQLERRRAEAEQRLAALDAEQSRLAEAAAAARKQLALAQAARELLERQREAERLRQLLTEADGRAAALAGLEAELAANPIDEARLRWLRELTAEVDRQEAGLLAQATRIELLPEPGRVARTAEGVVIDPSRPLDLTAPSELRLEGFGRIRVLPGGDLAARRHALAQARARLGDALGELGVADLAAAEQAVARRRDLERRLAVERQAQEGLLRGAGVLDLESLRARLRVEQRRLETGRQSLGEHADPEGLARELEAAARAAEESERALAAMRAEAEAAGRAAGAERERSAGLEGRRRELLRAVESARERILEAEARLAEEDLQRARDAAQARHREAVTRVAHIEQELARLDATGVRLRKEQAERELAALEGEILRCRREVDRLEGEVRGLGVEACDSRLDEIERQLGELKPRAKALEREASAWKLLRETLAEAERRGTERLVEPVSRRLLPYLQTLLPEAEPVIDAERLVPVALRREAIEEPLTELSVGTREQLAVLVRLALGELLLEREGEAPCLILDDALVFADEARFERMKAILAKAAQRQQILVLTCRPRDWLGMPGPRLRLEECRVREPASG
jgi:DNA repair exonuclease SbcCD ATPase subunit